jgi:lactoylglutathione lyase
MDSGDSRRVTGLRTVAVPVSDQDRALRFYTEVLGLSTRLDAEVEQLGGRWIEVAPEGADTSIALVPARSGHPTGVDTGIRLTTPDAAALHQELAGRGVEVGELLHWRGAPPMFLFTDPDGNTLEVVG